MCVPMCWLSVPAWADDAPSVPSAFTLSATTVQPAVALVASSVNGISLGNIDALMASAIETHPLVGAAEADYEAAGEGVSAAKMAFFPTPSISVGERDGDLVGAFTVRQPIWTGGRLTAEVNQAQYDQKAAEAQILERQHEVAKNVASVWQEWVYAQALQRLYDENIKNLTKFEEMMQRRVSQGVSARIELDLIQSRILQEYSAHQAASQQQKIAEARLVQMVGAPLDFAPVDMNNLVRYILVQSADFGDWAFAQTGEHHPSVVRQSYLSQAANAQMRAQEASKWPNVYVQYSYDYVHGSRNRQQRKGDFSVGMAYNPSAGFSNLALTRAQSARAQSLRKSQEAARRTVMENIQTQYQAFISARDQQASLLATLSGSKLVVESYQRQFIAGRKSWLEVLNAVREHSQYNQQLLQAQAQMVGSFYKLQVDFARMPWQRGRAISEPVPFSLKNQLQKMSDGVIDHGVIDHSAPTNAPTNTSSSTPTYTVLPIDSLGRKKDDK